MSNINNNWAKWSQHESNASINYFHEHKAKQGDGGFIKATLTAIAEHIKADIHMVDFALNTHTHIHIHIYIYIHMVDLTPLSQPLFKQIFRDCNIVDGAKILWS